MKALVVAERQRLAADKQEDSDYKDGRANPAEADESLNQGLFQFAPAPPHVLAVTFPPVAMGT